MFKKISLILLVATFIGFAIKTQAQTCSGSLTVTLTGSASGTATTAPTGSASQTFCAGSKVSDLVATGTAIQWYAAATGGSALATTTVLTNGTHYYASQTPLGACESVGRLDVTATVTPLPAVALTTGTAVQTVCTNVAVTNITYTVTNATGATVSGLPTGVSGFYSGGILTISGTPTASGSFNYTVTTTGGCSPAATATGSITVTPLPSVTLSSTTGTDAQTVCKNIAITNITYTVPNVTGATVSGLPTGVTGVYSAGLVTISGTPTVSGSFNYTVTTTGGCSPAATVAGSITVTATPTLILSSAAGTDAQTVCKNVAVINITYAITNATGATVTGLPSGVTGAFSAGIFTISGTPTASGTFNYTVTTSGGCSPAATATGSITVTATPTIALSSAVGTDAQIVCKNVAATNITYAVTNATGATVTGLPSGVTGAFSAGIFTISGTPTASGTFSYTVTTSGGCSPAATATGSITVTATPTLALSSAVGTDAQTVCKNVAVTNITYAVTNATGATVTGLPTGVTGSYSVGVVTISGTPTVSGAFTYTVTTTGGCSPAATATGSITVTATPTLALSSAAGTDAQTVCNNIAVTNITYSVTNAISATVSGLPTGVTGSYSGGVVTISGTPTAAGTFTYTVTTTGGCSPAATATGSITVNPAIVAATCTPVQDACQLSQGQIKLQVSAGTAPYTISATSKTVAPSPTPGIITPLTAPSADTTTDSGYSDYLFTGLPGNAVYKFKVVDSKGCSIGGTD